MSSRSSMGQHGALVAEGKTKRIYEAPEDPTKVVVEYKNDITAFDDPSKTKQFEKKAEYSNTTNARVFEMLNRAGIPTAFVKQLNDTEFMAEKCTMVPLEVVARRYAVGSYLSRHPELKMPDGDVPHRFDEPLVEFFLKTTRGGLTSAAGETLVEGLDPKEGQEDPFIPNPDEPLWKLVHPKKEAGDDASDIGKTVEAAKVLPSPEAIQKIREMITRTFETLEAFFTEHDFKFVDFKIEFGITHDGRLVVADVIDNDSWRLRDQDWKDVSKQSFRDGEDMGTVEDKYALVAALMEKSRL